MKPLLISAAYWSIVALMAAAIFLASNFAGSAGSPTYYRPTITVVVIGAMTYALGLIAFCRQKRF